MIIGSTQVLTASGSDGTEHHLRYGAENDRVTLVQRTWRDISDIFDDAAQLGRKYAIKHFVIAPFRPMSREFMLTVALPLLAKEFRFEPFECSIVEHEKSRAVVDAFNIHWHIVVPHFDPDTGKVGQRWWQDYQRQEIIARILEYKQWAAEPEPDPAGPDFLRGRFHEVNIDALSGAEDPELQIIGAVLELKLPRGIEPEGTAPPANVVRMHKRAGRDIVQLRKLCREAWRQTKTAVQFRQLLEAEGLYVMVAEEPPPRWMVTDGAAVLGTLAGMAHAKRDDVIKRMGDPKYDDWYAGRGSGGGSGEVDLDGRAARGHVGVVEGGVDDVPSVALEPERRHRTCSPGLFIAALKRVDPSRLDKIRARAIRLAESATAWAFRYFAAAEKAAKDYLARMKSDLPKVSEDLAELRATSDRYTEMLKAAEEKVATTRTVFNNAFNNIQSRKSPREDVYQEAQEKYDRAATARQKLRDAIEEHEKKTRSPKRRTKLRQSATSQRRLRNGTSLRSAIFVSWPVVAL